MLLVFPPSPSHSNAVTSLSTVRELRQKTDFNPSEFLNYCCAILGAIIAISDLMAQKEFLALYQCHF